MRFRQLFNLYHWKYSEPLEETLTSLNQFMEKLVVTLGLPPQPSPPPPHAIARVEVIVRPWDYCSGCVWNSVEVLIKNIQFRECCVSCVVMVQHAWACAWGDLGALLQQRTTVSAMLVSHYTPSCFLINYYSFSVFYCLVLGSASH